MVNRSGSGPAFARIRGLFLLVLLVAGCGFLLKRDLAAPAHSSSTPSRSTEIQAALRRLPLSFEPNQGQAAGGVEFLAHGNGYGLYLLPSRAVVALARHTKSGVSERAVEMQFGAGNRQVAAAGADRLAGHTNYFIGKDASRWLRNVPQFARVRYRDVYPGIDLAFYGNENRLEYDFDVSPGSDARAIELDFKGADEVSVAANGDLVLELDGGELRFEAPHVYQKTPAGVQTVAGWFVLRGKTSAGFEVGPYDRSRALVIDPVLTFSSYLGGAGAESCTAITGASGGFVPHCPSIALDSGNRIYVAGATTTPAGAGVFKGGTPNTIPPNSTAAENVFVSQISLQSTGGVTAASLNFVTYIGGATGTQYPVGVGVDSGFNVYVAGTTSASDYPTTSSAFQAAPASAGNHAFISKFDPTGSVNQYSTYLSGNGVDTASNMAIDTLGRVYVMGTTTSNNFPTTVGAIQPAASAANQFFFSKIDPALNTQNSLQYSTYIGGSAPSNGVVMGGAVTVDTNFNVYLAGGTNFTDMGPTWIVNAYCPTPPSGVAPCGEQGQIDVWAAKLNAPANNTQQYTLAYGTYLGGSGDDVAYGVSTDGTSTYITGSTTSTNIVVPTTTLSFQSANAGGGSDAFVAKFGAPAVVGTTQGQVPLDYFSYLGGTGADVGLGIAADSLGNARVVGFTDSGDLCAASMTTCGPLQASSGGGRDAFIARLNTVATPTITNPSTASYFGGAGTDIGTGIALDSFLNTYVAGETSSANFPVCPGPECAAGSGALPNGTALSGASDAFVSEIGPNTAGLSMPATTDATALPACMAANPTVSPSPVGVGSPATFTYYIYNTGDPVSGVNFTNTLGVGSGSTTATTSQGTCSGATTTGPLTCSLGTVNTSTITGSTTSTVKNSCGSTTSTNFAAKVTVTVTAPTTVLQGQGSIGNSANISFPGGSTATISGSVPLNDFSVSAMLAPGISSTQASGGQFNYIIKVTPTGAGFSESVSIACGSGVPAGGTCTPPSAIPNLTGGPKTATLSISTSPRVTTTAGFFRRGPAYAIWLPVLGIGIMGAGVSRRRRSLFGIFFALVLGTVLVAIGCSSGTNSTTTTGTPAGTYTVVVNATSGSAVRSTSVQFTVQ